MPPKRRGRPPNTQQQLKKTKTTKGEGEASNMSKSADHLKACPELFTVPPPQSGGKKKPGQLTATQLRQFYNEGFLIIPSFFKPDEFDPVLETIDKEVDLIADRLYKAGKITDKCENADVFHRFIELEKEFPAASLLLHKTGRFPEAFQNLWTNERLLNMMEQLVGPEIAGNPVWNLRPKTVYNEEATVPWHQDNAYMDEMSQEVFFPTVWIPLLDVNKNNGCLQFVRGGHRTGALATHTCCAGGTWYVEVSEEEMIKKLGVDMDKDVVTCEMKKGSLLLFNNLVPHRSLENYSDKIRWTFDFRFQKAGTPAAFHGLKDPILLRSKKNPNHQIKWKEFNNVDRNAVSAINPKAALAAEKADEFDTILSGPWMHRWELVHHNRHTTNWE